MGLDVTVITATIPTRTNLLARAIASVNNQSAEPEAHLISVDINKRGHCFILDQLLNMVTTKYVAILDDDDELLENHIEILFNKIIEEDADLVYPHFKYSNLPDGGHLERFKGKLWDNKFPHQVPITWIAKTETILKVGGFSTGFDILSFKLDHEGNRIGEDFVLIQKLCEIDAKIVHTPEITWTYHVGHESTLGMPNRW